MPASFSTSKGFRSTRQSDSSISGKRESDLYPYYGATGQVGWIDDYLFDEPLILLAEDGADFGSQSRPIAYAVTGRYWVNNHAHVLRPKPGVDFDFLLFALMIRPDLGDLASGSTRAKLNQAVARGILVPLPRYPSRSESVQRCAISWTRRPACAPAPRVRRRRLRDSAPHRSKQSWAYKPQALGGR